MKKIVRSLLLVAFLGTFNACSDDEPPLPDNLAAFEATEKGFEGEETEIKISLTRAVDAATPVSVTLTPTQLTYDTEFTTTPAAANNTITLSVPAGQSSVSFKVNKKSGVLLDGDESIAFKIASVGTQVLVGTTSALKLSFKAIISEGTSIQLNGIAAGEPGSSAANSVFLDLSANAQTPVLRNSWDLGFYGGSDFRVTINGTNGASALVINKTDINAVSDKDFKTDSLAVGQGTGKLSLVDDATGDLTKTAIAAVSATDADNKVYILNRKGGSMDVLPVADLYKIRILRKGSGYTLQYAKVNDTTFKTLDITKDAAYNFEFVSLEKGATVDAEPAKDRWDLKWGYSMYFTNFGTGLIPYGFSDLVFTNSLGGVEAAEVLTTTATYDAFAESNLAGITFSKAADVIGSKWRVTQGTIGVKTDRFYLVKDPAGNIYKLKFISFHASDGGERGKPKLEYKLVKKGA
ncbi:HmuY family protein [Dyadobacter jiangsuensis]|uniref:Heme-binding HmuY-like protein n=1 Tax=Dyadobacter jiangsuensis TaxID=1591085 RepID=A0A2P8FTY0_9BACT|nr:HmuY family protein [Dyadobacter jiangsuensis]PSL25180.1 heme-binding HmuY-like protein [Dyadobacter jiangsuensis]